MPERVAGREGDAHAAVAEDVERAAEALVGRGVGALEVERAVVEGVVELALAVAVLRPLVVAAAHSALLTRNVASPKSDDRAGVVGVQVGHDHDVPIWLAAMPRARSCADDRLLGRHLDVFEDERRARPRFACRLDGDRGVEAGVDQHRAGAGVVDEERGHRQAPPLAARHAEAERLAPGQPAGLAQEERRRADRGAGQQRLDADGGALLAAGQRQRRGPGLGGGSHRATLARAGSARVGAAARLLSSAVSERPSIASACRSPARRTCPAQHSLPVRDELPSERMPIASASRGPSGISAGIQSRIASNSASLRAVRLELRRRERDRVGAEEHLQQGRLAQLAELVGRLGAPGRRAPRDPCR